jgi:hypothetical protein
LTVEFFKRLQVLEMTQERFGSRLCWAPCVKDPAFDFVERIRRGREEIIKRAEDAAVVASKPTPPTPPPVQQHAGKPPVWVTSSPVEADKWGLTNDMSADYDVTITAPDGYVWDGDTSTVKNSLSITWEHLGNRSHHGEAVLEPWSEGTDVKLKVHIGVDWKILIGESRGHVYITAAGNFVPAAGAGGTTTGGQDDPEYKKAWAAYQLQLQAWQQGVEEARAEARAKGAQAADAWEKDVAKQFNPIAELMNRVIAHHFPPAVRDDCWEIDLWQNVFDWESASYTAYPAWWGGAMRDWTKDPVDFMNASWAKLYIPVKVGFELVALRWIFDKVMSHKSDAKKEAAFAKIVKELESFRTSSFGDKLETAITGTVESHTEHADDDTCPVYEEKFLCLGHWHEVMPTDGTHVEVVQGMTSAEDPFTTIEVDTANKLRAMSILSQEQDVELKKKAVTAMADVTTGVTIDTDGHGDVS